MTDPTTFMREALTLARKALDQGELPIAALVVVGDRILAAAHTAERTEGRLLVHAELRALEAADRLRPFPGRRTDAHLFTTLEPCLMCFGAAMSCRVGSIAFALESPDDGATALLDCWQQAVPGPPAYPYHFPSIQGGIMRNEAIALFQEYATRFPTGGLGQWAKTLASNQPPRQRPEFRPIREAVRRQITERQWAALHAIINGSRDHGKSITGLDADESDDLREILSALGGAQDIEHGLRDEGAFFEQHPHLIPPWRRERPDP